MLRKAALVLIPIMLLAAACGGGGKDDAKTTNPTATPVADAATPGAAATSAPTAAPPGSTRGATGKTGSGGEAASALFDTVNPFELLGEVGGAPSSGGVDPSLSAALLDSSDLPGGFMSLGDFTYNVPSEYGSIQLAANMFASGDFMSGDLGGMVMSAALSLPPEVLDQIDAQGGIDQLAALTDADLQEIEGFAGEYGMAFDDLHLLDASGLGDGGMGMHMAMDFGGLMSAFGAPEGENPFAGGLAIDMYIFLRGDHMLMAMVMWPAAESSGVDSRGLAEALDANASGIF
jgi:hypothetical protein